MTLTPDDLQAIGQLINQAVEASEQRMTAKIEAVEQRMILMVETLIKASEKRMIDLIRLSEERMVGLIQASEAKLMALIQASIKASEEKLTAVIKLEINRQIVLFEELREHFETSLEATVDSLKLKAKVDGHEERISKAEANVALLEPVLKNNSDLLKSHTKLLGLLSASP